MAGDQDVQTQAARWYARLRGPDGERDRAAFTAWRDADPRHAAAFARLENDWKRTGILQRSALSDAVRLQPSWWKRLNLDRPRILAPACALLVLVLLLGIWAARARAPEVATAIAQSTRLGEVRTLSLADGSRVTLDTDSAVTEMFTAGERMVRLVRGRARFDVVHDTSRSFIVIAGVARITDKGTIFDVRLGGHQVDVVLLRGSVEVQSLAPAVAAKPAIVVLVAGQRASVAADQAPMIVHDKVGSQSNWVSGMLDFDDTPLADMLAELNRYNARHIILGDRRLGSLRVTGAFRASAPGDIARNLAALFDLRVHTDDQGNWVLLPK